MTVSATSTRSEPRLFTCARIAVAMGRSRQRVKERMKNATPSGVVIVSGNEAAAWEFSALPVAIRQALADAARRKGYPSALALLSAPARRWSPPVPLNRISPDTLARAGRLRDAIGPSVRSFAEAPSGPATELIALALDAYGRVFKTSITSRHLRRLLLRTIERDNGFKEWDRVELYLDERPGVIAPLAPASNGGDMPRLADAIAGIVDASTPTAEGTDLIWFSACEDVAAVTDRGVSRTSAIRAAVRLLMDAPGIAGKSHPAVEKTLRRRLARWELDGGTLSAIQDGRRDNRRENGRVKVCEYDRNLILSAAITSSLSVAWDKLLREGSLSPELSARYVTARYSKSYVPTSIRRELQPLLDAMQPHRRGPRAATLAGAYIDRDPTTIAAGDWFQADDTTLPVYYWTTDATGTIQLMRGQLLAMIDVRSLMVVGFVLISERNYTAFHIRKLITRVADEHGLPRKGFYFENGAWKSAKILKGAANERPWAETEHGLLSLGLRFQHARWPRGKVVECAIGLFQNMMEASPGYCGRNEQTDTFERVKRAIQQGRAGKLDPRAAFWSEQEWYEQLTQLFNRYNETVQEGKYCNGRSPRETFEAAYASPMVRLSGSVRYILAMHRMSAKVTGNGITVRFGSQRFCYKGEATGQFVGRTVTAFFNPEAPETLAFELEGRREIYTVEREITVPAMDAPADVLSAAMRQNDAQNRPIRELYRSIAPQFSPEFVARRFRTTLADEISIQRGQILTRHADEIQKERAASEVSERAANRAARDIGLNGAAWSHDPDRRQQQAEAMRELRGLGITMPTDER